jgi:uncharacterized membrane protein YfcA
VPAADPPPDRSHRQASGRGALGDAAPGVDLIATLLLSAAAVLAAAFVKGAIGFGFPTLSTPLLAMVLDVKSAVAVLILPNIVMDGLQAARTPGLLATLRRLGPLIACGMVGTVIGTRALVGLSSRAAVGVLGGFVLAFVVLNATPVKLQVPPRWERWVSPPAGLLAGIVGGMTNVPGTPLVIYFYALSMPKAEFVRSVAVSFVIYKLTQLAAVVWFGLLTPALLGWSLAITGLALLTFRLGLAVQDRFDQRTFSRAVLVFLAALGTWLITRSL